LIAVSELFKTKVLQVELKRTEPFLSNFQENTEKLILLVSRNIPTKKSQPFSLLKRIEIFTYIPDSLYRYLLAPRSMP
jgi:hypothetical protein